MPPSENPRGARDAVRAKWTRALVFLGGSVFGLMLDWEALWPALSHRPFRYGQHNALYDAGSVLGEFVLPIVIAFLAPRKSFLWAAAALGVGLIWSLLDRVVALNGPGLLHDLRTNTADALATLLILCGPISLIRLLLRRRHDGKVQRLAAQQAWLQQVPDPDVGVWPPPIRPSNPPGDV